MNHALKAALRRTYNFAKRALGDQSPKSNYISASTTIAAAQSAGISVCEYVERLWNQAGRTQFIIDRMTEQGAVTPGTNSVVEIGPGTGRYTEKLLAICKPKLHQLYETDAEWRTWLGKTYPVQVPIVDGKSLRQTPSKSIELIHAHGVFVYLPFLITYRYFSEICRIAASASYIVFDIISEECVTPELTRKWIAAEHYFATFLSVTFVVEFFEKQGFKLIDRFLTDLDVGKSEYLIFGRQAQTALYNARTSIGRRPLFRESSGPL